MAVEIANTSNSFSWKDLDKAISSEQEHFDGEPLPNIVVTTAPMFQRFMNETRRVLRSTEGLSPADFEAYMQKSGRVTSRSKLI